jgi:hypothetical protein
MCILEAKLKGKTNIIKQNGDLNFFFLKPEREINIFLIMQSSKIVYLNRII